MYRCYHILISCCATFRYCQMCWLLNFSCFVVKTAWSYLQLFCHNTLSSQTTYRKQTTFCDKSGTSQCNCNISLTWTSIEKSNFSYMSLKLKTRRLTEITLVYWLNGCDCCKVILSRRPRSQCTLAWLATSSISVVVARSDTQNLHGRLQYTIHHRPACVCSMW